MSERVSDRRGAQAGAHPVAHNHKRAEDAKALDGGDGRDDGGGEGAGSGERRDEGCGARIVERGGEDGLERRVFAVRAAGEVEGFEEDEDWRGWSVSGM